MSWVKKSTGLAADLDNLVLIDDDNTTIIDIGNIDSGPILDPSASLTDLGQPTRAMVIRRNGFDVFGVTFTTNPVLKHGNGQGGSGQFAIFAPGPSDFYAAVVATSNDGFGISRSGNGTGDGYTAARGANLNSFTPSAKGWGIDFSSLIVVVMNYEFDTADGQQLYSDLIDTGAATAWDTEEASTLNGGSGGEAQKIGALPGQGFIELNLIAYGNANRRITLAEAQQIRADWFGYLVEAGAATPDITSVGGDNVILEGETGVAIVGTGFEFPNNTGTVILSDNSTFGAGNEVTQTVTNWASDTLVEFTANFTGTTVAEGGTAYVFVTNNSAETNPTTAGSTITRQDATSPSLTGATVTNITDTGAQGNVTTNEDNGFLYGVVSESASIPTPAQIQAGLDGDGVAGVWVGSQAVVATGLQSQTAVGLGVGVSYFFFQQQRDLALNDSNVTSTAFATTSPGVLASTLLDNADNPVINETAMNVYILSTTDGSLVHTFTAQTTDGSGVWTNSDSSIVTGTTYHIVAAGVTDAGIEQTVTAT